MTGLELAASVVAVIDLSAKVAAMCSTYYTDVKHAKDDVSRLQDEANTLNKTLKLVQQLLDGPNGEKLKASRNLCGAINDCFLQLKGLGKILEPGKRRKAMSRGGFRALTWPLKSKEVENIVTNLLRRRDAIILGLHVDQATLILDLDQKVNDIRVAIAGDRSIIAQTQPPRKLCSIPPLEHQGVSELSEKSLDKEHLTITTSINNPAGMPANPEWAALVSEIPHTLDRKDNSVGDKTQHVNISESNVVYGNQTVYGGMNFGP